MFNIETLYTLDHLKIIKEKVMDYQYQIILISLWVFLIFDVGKWNRGYVNGNYAFISDKVRAFGSMLNNKL